MAQKIINRTDLENLARQLHSQNKKIVLVGGGFDILHRGHITFLEAAKKHGDTLILLLESDATLTAKKGKNRPVNTQRVRANILATLPVVDYIVLLPRMLTHEEYDTVVLQIKPAIIATTKGDPGRNHKERQAKQIGGSVLDVTTRLPEYASSFLAQKITNL